MRVKVLLAAAAAGAVSFVALPASAGKVLLDQNLIATYTATSDDVEFHVCGRTKNSSGCYGGGGMSPPFEQACAVLEGIPKQKGDVVTRAIYVLDKRTLKNDPVTLYVYTRTDTITDSFDKIQVTFRKAVPLGGVVGGVKSKCFMAGGDAFLYAGTDASVQADAVDKKALTVSTVGGTGGTLTSIAADGRGFIAVNFQDDEASIFDPSGSLVQESTNEYVVSSRDAWVP